VLNGASLLTMRLLVRPRNSLWITPSFRTAVLPLCTRAYSGRAIGELATTQSGLGRLSVSVLWLLSRCGAQLKSPSRPVGFNTLEHTQNSDKHHEIPTNPISILSHMAYLSIYSRYPTKNGDWRHDSKHRSLFRRRGPTFQLHL
jgi:hypothetical protein